MTAPIGFTRAADARHIIIRVELVSGAYQYFRMGLPQVFGKRITRGLYGDYMYADAMASVLYCVKAISSRLLI